MIISIASNHHVTIIIVPNLETEQTLQVPCNIRHIGSGFLKLKEPESFSSTAAPPPSPSAVVARNKVESL